MRPVCEMQFADFISCGFDQLVNVAGKMHYRQGLAGADHGAPAQRRRLLAAARSTPRTPRRGSCTRPGLKVVAPSTAEDAKGLLIAAIRDPNPVVFLEHKHLYRRVQGRGAPTAPYETPFTARVAREGDDLVVIAYGAMVHTALEATEDLDGAAVEVLDLRSLVPLDEEAILDSVRRCSKVVILDEANATCAAGAQVAALIAEQALRGPRRTGRAGRHARRADPVLAAARAGACCRQVDRVKEACRELLAY